MVHCAFCNEFCAIGPKFEVEEFEGKHLDDCCWKFVNSPEEFLDIPKDENILLEFLSNNANTFKDKAPKLRMCKEYLSTVFVIFILNIWNIFAYYF